MPREIRPEPLIFPQGVPEVPNLKFLDQYPRVSETLPFSEVAGWSTVLEHLQVAFDALPRR